MKCRNPQLKVLPVMVCREEQMKDIDFQKKVEELKRFISTEVQILEACIITSEKDIVKMENRVSEADVILLYKPRLGLGNCVVKIIEFNLPVILFNEEGSVWTPLDALEYVYPRDNVWVVVDYEDIDFRLKILEARKRIGCTKLLVLNSDYPHWERWLMRVSGGLNSIKERFGIVVEYVGSEEVVKRWKEVGEERVKEVVEKWMEQAEKIIEPSRSDVEKVARLYLVIKDLLAEKNAQGLTMAYGDDPLPVPCFAYTTLRDEGVPAACEADIISLLLMVILHYLTGKPSFMGNTRVDLEKNMITISHCVAPMKMAGYDKPSLPYVLRNQHWGLPAGVLSAFVPMNPNHEVTVCRLDGELRNMLITKGVIEECRDLKGYCRNTVSIRISNVKKFIHSTSGNHHVVVYDDHREEIRELNKLFGISTIEV
ncbi:hypothetical protein KEJ25_07615 [Candidatus Bathyarchaeota archaeon]|nr:hypothetical protein [Candidatus Bathyarchaeota archaeon]